MIDEAESILHPEPAAPTDERELQHAGPESAVRSKRTAGKKSARTRGARRSAEQQREGRISKKGRSQRPFPAAPFEESLSFATAIFEYGRGQPVRRLSLFDHLQKSPESGHSRQTITNASKYGLIRGNYTAEQLELSADGLKAVDDEISERERAKARVKLAVSDIEPFGKLYQRFNGNKLPARSAMIDALIEFGVPSVFCEEAVDTFVVNLRFVGLLKTLSGAERLIGEDYLLESLPSSPISSRVVHDNIASAASGDRDQALITISHAAFESTCFYITPIGEEGSEQRRHSDLFLGSFIEPALEQFQLRVVRADKIDKPGIITRQIIDYILRSRVVIADLSFHNPNVFYELALRHAIRKPVIQLVRAREKVPFDINQMRTITIDDADIYTLLPMVQTYRSEIATQVRRAIDTPTDTDTPISIYYPNFRVALD